MTITVAQTIRFDQSVGTSHQNTGVTTTAGRLLVIAALDQSSGVGQVTGVTDSASNTWTKICGVNDTGNLSGASIWATSTNASALSSGSYTVTTSANCPLQSQFYEIAGVAGAVDKTSTGSGSGTSLSSGSTGALTDTADLVIGICGFGFPTSTPSFTSTTFTGGAGTQVTHPTTPAGFQASCVTASLILAGSSAAQTLTATGSPSSTGWAAAIATWTSTPAFSADGSGTCTADKSSAPVSRTGNTITLTYTAATNGTSSGAVTIDIPTGWSAPSVTSSAAGYSTATSTGSIGTLSVSGQTITIPSVTLTTGQTITIVYGNKTSGGPGATSTTTVGAQTWQAKEKSTAGGTLTNLASSPSIIVEPYVALENYKFARVASSGMWVGERIR